MKRFHEFKTNSIGCISVNLKLKEKTGAEKKSVTDKKNTCLVFETGEYLALRLSLTM